MPSRSTSHRARGRAKENSEKRGRTASWMMPCCHPGIASPRRLFLVVLLVLNRHCDPRTGGCHRVKTRPTSSCSVAGTLLFFLDTARSIQEQSDTFISPPAHPASLRPGRPWQAALSPIFVPIYNLSCSCLFVPCESAAEPSYQFIVAAGLRRAGL